jgi:outer membrane protein OmpA-like peptidoglycan-associated protein
MDTPTRSAGRMKTPAAISTKEAPAKQAGRQSSAQAVQVPRPVFGAPIIIQRKCACGGGCPSCQKEELEESHPIQTKLKVNTPGDTFEQEADRIADQVVATNSPLREAMVPLPVTPVTPSLALRKSFESASSSVSYAVEESRGRAPPTISNTRDHLQGSSCPPLLQRKCACSGGVPCSQCEDEPETLAQRKVVPGSRKNIAGPETLPQNLGFGQPLDVGIRLFMESRFGSDFSQVRIHDDARAASAAHSVNALAYTIGRDIVFGEGRYAPSTVDGKKLLAHELTHVLQQGSHTDGFGLPRVSATLLQRQALSPGSSDLERTSGEEDASGTGKLDGASLPSSPVCPPTPTGLGAVEPSPQCVKKPDRDIGLLGRHFHFCPDSDVLVAETATSVAAFVGRQASDATYTVHGYASPEGGITYNLKLACHRANRMVSLLTDAGVESDNIIQVASKGPTSEFPGGPEFNRVAVVLAEVPPERRFGQFRPDPACPSTPTNLGNVLPDPPCPDNLRNLGAECKNLDPAQTSDECDSFLFCLDSDIFLAPETPGRVMKFARLQPATSHFTIHGFTSDEGPRLHDYNVRLSCHRANRLARELMKVGVPPEQIELAAKGPTTQFGDPEANRVGVIRVTPPTIGPAATVSKPTTPAEKHAIVDQAVARLNTGGYRLEADAYISFWTCGRVPTIRHAVNTTHWYVENDPGVPKYKHFPFTTDPPITGEAGGRLGLNAAVVSDDVFFDHASQKLGKLTDVMAALTFLSFFDKVSDEDFGTDRKRDSERDKAAFHLAMLEGLNRPDPDPRKDKPAPRCLKVPEQTFKGVPEPGEVGHTIPTFEVNSVGFQGGPGATVFIAPVANNKGSMESDGAALTAQAKVTLHGPPQEFQRYEVGFVLTIVEDQTSIKYRAGEGVNIGLPVPLRDTDGLKPREPWYSDSAFETPKQGRVEVSMSKIMAQEMALRFAAISGERPEKLGSALSSAERHSRYQLWLVARRRGAPLDRFSTHFLSGTLVDFNQDLDVSGKSPTGKFRTTLPFGSDPEVVRFSGPVPQDLGPKEATTSNVISACTSGFGKVEFEVDNKSAKRVSNVVFLLREPMTFMGKTVPGLSVLPNPSPLDYQPLITMRIRDARAEADKFEVGLIQNLLEFDWQNHYSTGEVVFSRCTQSLPLRDSDEKPGQTDDVFMSNHEPELAQLSLQRRQAKLKLTDVPGGKNILDLADNPACPGKKTGKLTRIIGTERFRTWVGVRFNKDASCLNFLHRIDWTMKYVVTVNPDKVVSAELTPTGSDDSGSPSPTLTGLANRDCGSAYGEVCS